MNDCICFLITLLDGTDLVRCALKVRRDMIDSDVISYPMEPDNREVLYNLLPLHVRNIGNIVHVSADLLDVVVKDK